MISLRNENETQLVQDIKLKNLFQENQRLRRKNLIYEKLLTSITDGFLVVGLDGNIIDINQAYCDYLGLNRTETLGRPVCSVISNSKMLEVVSNNLCELDVMHTYSDEMIIPCGESTVCVSRIPVVEDGKIIAAVATIKFSHHTINLAKRLQKLEQKVAYYRARLSHYTIDSFVDLASECPAYNEAKHLAERFANSDLPILLLGETGAGKEVFANSIHHASNRAEQPFVCVNCAAIPAELLESELFGYVDGAFTGTRRSGKKGKFEIANGGTLFLDEIAEIPIQMQSKLLRVLQSQEVEKLGAEKTVRVDVRIIAATNIDLLEAIQAQTFRSDLYYRLNVLTVKIPPLRERIEDIPLLSNSVLKELNSKYHRNISLPQITVDVFRHYNWPGNIRELKNVISRGYMIAEGNEILPKHLSIQKKINPGDVYTNQTISDVTKHAQKKFILKCLHKNNWNFSRTASDLGIHRTTLYARIRSMGVDVKSLRSNPDVQREHSPGTG